MIPAMQRFILLAVVLSTACTDWRSLYKERAEDGSLIARQDPEDAGQSAEKLDAGASTEHPDDAVAPEPIACAAAGPLVRWKFDGHGAPGATTFIPDLACRAPDVSLGWDLERNSRNTQMLDGALYLDGGFLFSDRPVSDELGQLVMRSGSFAILLWLRALRTETGTIFATNGIRDTGRAFSIAQKDGTLHFAVRTTATDPMGERFATAGTLAEITVPLPVESKAPVQVVAMYSRQEGAATVYVDGVRVDTVLHARPGAADPAPVWATGRNQLGLGGAFEGTAWHGWLHEVALFDRALPAAEVERLFVAGPGGATW